MSWSMLTTQRPPQAQTAPESTSWRTNSSGMLAAMGSVAIGTLGIREGQEGVGAAEISHQVTTPSPSHTSPLVVVLHLSSMVAFLFIADTLARNVFIAPTMCCRLCSCTSSVAVGAPMTRLHRYTAAS